MGKSSINGPFSMAMLKNQRVYIFISIELVNDEIPGKSAFERCWLNCPAWLARQGFSIPSTGPRGRQRERSRGLVPGFDCYLLEKTSID